MISSFVMALRYSFDMQKEADLIDQAVAAVLAKGLRTADIKSDGAKMVSTQQMGEAIVAEMDQLAK
jgi:3-isopropylmalate dehydrogenase